MKTFKEPGEASSKHSQETNRNGSQQLERKKRLIFTTIGKKKQHRFTTPYGLLLQKRKKRKIGLNSGPRDVCSIWLLGYLYLLYIRQKKRKRIKNLSTPRSLPFPLPPRCPAPCTLYTPFTLRHIHGPELSPGEKKNFFFIPPSRVWWGGGMGEG